MFSVQKCPNDWDVVVNGRVGHYVNDLLLLVVESSSFSSSSSPAHTSERTERQSAYTSLARPGIGLQSGMSTPSVCF